MKLPMTLLVALVFITLSTNAQHQSNTHIFVPAASVEAGKKSSEKESSPANYIDVQDKGNTVEDIKVVKTLSSNDNNVSNNNTSSVKNEETATKFTVIPATGYTDPNYQENLEKSKIVSEQLNASKIELEIPEPTIEDYIKLRDSFPVNSNQYFLIQEKIYNLESRQK